MTDTVHHKLAATMQVILSLNLCTSKVVTQRSSIVSFAHSMESFVAPFLFILSASLLCSLHFVLVETSLMVTLLGKSYSLCSLSVLSGKCYVVFFMYFLSRLVSMLGQIYLHRFLVPLFLLLIHFDV